MCIAPVCSKEWFAPVLVVRITWHAKKMEMPTSEMPTPAPDFRKSLLAVSPAGKNKFIFQPEKLPPSTDGGAENRRMEGLRPSSHQVAGHRFEEGRQGCLVDSSGRFYKPVQGDGRGEAEASFYRNFSSDPDIPPAILKFFPRYHGVEDIPQEGTQNLCRHIILEDVTYGYRQPCVLDLKIGRRTWHEDQAAEYRLKCQTKDAATTSAALGYRLTGMQVFSQGTKKMWKADRRWCKSLTAASSSAALAQFVFGTPSNEVPSARAQSMAVKILGGPTELICQLLELRSWFASQSKYQFLSTSLLFIFEGDTSRDAHEDTDVQNWDLKRPKVWMIDFAHVVYDKGGNDENFIDGIDSVTNALNVVLLKT